MWHSSWTTTRSTASSGQQHQEAGKAQAVFSAAAAVPLSGGRDFDAGGSYPHQLAPVSHLTRQNFQGLFLEGGDFLWCGRRRHGELPPALTLQMSGNPVRVAENKVVDGLPGQPRRGPDQHTALWCDLQGQGPALGANEFILFHIIHDTTSG